ncbi:Glucosyltransferase I RfaG OS=Stutzerimonas stutzeri OX=316 GN=CXK95_05890 PE=4 SV=1 [Stutzerimonas stutzeri]
MASAVTAHYIEDAACGCVVPSPFEQATLDQLLAQTLADDEQRARWRRNALPYAEIADL